MASRKQTDPGGWQSPPGSVAPEDEIPTRPENADPDTLTLVRVFGELAPLERRKVAHLVENWSRCTHECRHLLENLARELRNENR